MIRAEKKTVINRPAHDVFTYIADFGNLPRYDRWVTAAKQTSDGPPAMGSTWTHTRTQGRRVIEAPITITEFEPDRRVAIQSGSKGFDVRSTQTVTPAGDGSSELTELLEMRLSGMVRLVEPMIRRQVPTQLETVHARLKEVLENS